MTVWHQRGGARIWRGDRVAHVLLAVSLSINVLLARERVPRVPAAEAETIVGAILPAVPVSTPDGTVTSLTWSGRDTIVYYFHPDCGWCERNVDAVLALERQTRGRFDFVALTTASPDGRTSRVPSTTYWALADAERRRLRLSGTPQTLLIGRGGRVLQAFAGAYAGAIKDRVERFFQVELPTIAPSRPSTR